MSHTHRLATEQWPFDEPVDRAAYSTANVLERRLPVLLVVHDEDGDWQVLCGLTDDPLHGRVACLGCLLDIEPSIASLADLPRGWCAWRESPDAPWHREMRVID